MKSQNRNQNQRAPQKVTEKKLTVETVHDRLERKAQEAHKRLNDFYDYEPTKDRATILPHSSKEYPIRLPKGTNL